MRNNKHHSPHLQAAWNKYGEKHFVFQILETCEPIKDTLMLLEQKYLDLKPEYNIQCTAYSCLGRRFSEKEKQEITKKRLKSGFIEKVNKPVIQADALLKHELMNKNRKIVSCAISMCARGISKTAYKYVWEYEN